MGKVRLLYIGRIRCHMSGSGEGWSSRPQVSHMCQSIRIRNSRLICIIRVFDKWFIGVFWLLFFSTCVNSRNEFHLMFMKRRTTWAGIKFKNFNLLLKIARDHVSYLLEVMINLLNDRHSICCLLENLTN